MSYKCEVCKREFNYADEMVFIDAAGDEVWDSEQYAQDPDHIEHIYCIPCADEIKYSVELGSER